MEPGAITGAESPPVGQGQQRRQGGVAAEGYLADGREPAQHPPLLALEQEGRFRLAETGGHRLHPIVGHRSLQGHHGRAIAPEGAAAEGLDQHGGQGTHAQIPLHQGPNRPLGIDTTIEQQNHLFTDWQPPALATGQGHGGPGGARTLHGGPDATESLLLAEASGQQAAEALVAAEAAGGRSQQIAEPRQSVKGGWLAPEGLEHHPDLRQTPAEERSPGIGSQPQTIADASRQGHHIFEGTGRFRADGVAVGVKPQVWRAQCSLKAAGQVAIVAGDHTRRRQTALQLIRQIRARENGRRRLGKLLPP